MTGRRTRRWWRAALAGLAATTFSGCASADDAVVALEGDLGHVHDLVVDPDGSLLVASHTGLYRIDGPERAVLVGEQHDLMALVGIDEQDHQTLIASGHPNLQLERYRVDGHPPFLGIIRSTDGGLNWEIVDLLGDADFHAIAPAAQGLFAAEGGGTIWFRPGDGDAWTQLGEVEARDLAVNPHDRVELVATGWDGEVWESTDGAGSWRRTDGAPPLIEVEWTSGAGIVGVTADGEVWTSPGVGRTWDRLASVPTDDEIETFMIDATGTWWTAAHGGAILDSGDGGETWSTVYTPPARN